MSQLALNQNDAKDMKILAVLPMRAFAEAAHVGQLYGPHPYTYHLDKGIAILRENQIEDLDLYGAFYLHDYWEDVPNASETIVRRANCFSERAIKLSKAVTDPSGQTRKERKQKFYQQLINFSRQESDLGAVVIKLIDRIANVTESIQTNNAAKFLMYKKELPALLNTVRMCIEIVPNDPHIPLIQKLIEQLTQSQKLEISVDHPTLS